MAQQQWKERSCCNPFQKENHDWTTRRKTLRYVTEWMCKKIPTISMGSKICDNCRKQLYKLPDSPYKVPEPLDPELSQPDSTDEYEVSDLDLSSINQCLKRLGRLLL